MTFWNTYLNFESYWKLEGFEKEKKRGVNGNEIVRKRNLDPIFDLPKTIRRESDLGLKNSGENERERDLEL